MAAGVRALARTWSADCRYSVRRACFGRRSYQGDLRAELLGDRGYVGPVRAQRVRTNPARQSGR